MDKYVPDISIQCYELINRIICEPDYVLRESKITMYTRFFTKWYTKCDAFYHDPDHLLDFEKYQKIISVLNVIKNIFADNLRKFLLNEKSHIQRLLNMEFDKLLELFDDEEVDVRFFIQEFIGEFIGKYTPPRSLFVKKQQVFSTEVDPNAIGTKVRAQGPKVP